MNSDSVPIVTLCGFLGSGKTTLLRYVGRRCAGADESEPVRTMPTIGQEVEYLSGPGARVMLQEIGGCLAPTWPRYYDRAAAVLFVVDAAARAMASATRATVTAAGSSPLSSSSP